MSEQVHGPDAAGPWPVDAELVLRHDRMLRRLAGRLLRDPAAADDVVQETWLAALRGGPGARAAWPLWLRRVVERLAGRRWRGERRRARREQSVAREEAVPGDDVVRAREAWRKRIVEAVLALPEPYRGTLVLRYLEALPPRDVARRMQVPVETVRTRTRRGIELLRQQLGQCAPDWRHGALSLFGWERESIGALAGGVGMTSVAMKGAAAVLVVGCGALLWWMAAGSDGSSGDGDVPDESALAMTAKVTPREGPRGPADEAAVTTVRVRVPSNDAAAPKTGALRILTRWSDNGTPAPGVFVAVREEGATMTDPRGAFMRTDEQGLCLLDGLMPGERWIGAPGMRVQRVEGARVAAGETHDAVVELARGLLVRGRVHDQHGRPVPNAAIWAAQFEAHPALAMTTTDAAGRFELRGIGEYSTISARATGFAPSARHMIVAVEGTTTVEQDLLMIAHGSGLRGRVFAPNGAPVGRAILLLGQFEGGLLSMSVILPDGTRASPPAALQIATDDAGCFAAEGLQSGDLPVQVIAHGRGIWEGKVALEPGKATDCSIHLVRGATLFGTVRNPDGSSATGARVHISREPRINNATIAEQRRSAGPAGDFRFDDLPEGELTLAVTAGGCLPIKQLVQVQSGTATRVDLQLTPSGSFVGRVLDSHGRPLAGATVQITCRGWGAHPVTDADGRFTLSSVPTDPRFEVRITRADELVPCVALRDVQPVGREILIRVPASAEGVGCFRARVLDGRGRPVPKATVLLDGRSVATDPETGALAPHRLPVGRYTLRIQAPGFGRVQIEPDPLLAGETRDLGDVVLSPGAVLELRVAGDVELADANVSLLDVQGIWVDRMVPADGLLRSPLVAPGRYRVIGTFGDHVAAPLTVELDAGKTTQQALRLVKGVNCTLSLRSPAPHLTGTIELEDGIAAAFFQLTAKPKRTGVLTGRVLLAPGNYRARLHQQDGDLGAPQPFRVDAGSTPTIELRPR